MTPRLRLLPAAFLLLAGCKLVDQTTFAPAPEAPDAAQLAALPPIDPRPPLLAIRYATPAPDYAAPLRTAIGAAEQRRPGTLYAVVAVVPGEIDPALQARDLYQARNDAAGVMQSMMVLGIPDDRIRLGARTDPTVKLREVRVYLP